jgi:hypothetical protein
LSTKLAGPPMQVQSSPHSVDISHDRSAGNIKSGSTPCQNDPPSVLRQVAACSGAASTSTQCHPEYKVTISASGNTMLIGAGVEISEPPLLAGRLLAQHRRNGKVMPLLVVIAVWQDDSGVRLEDRRDGSCDGPARGYAIGDPRDLGTGPDGPITAVLDPPDRQARIIGHATSLDKPVTNR